MANIEQPAGFTNVLLVTDSDMFNADYRVKLRDILYNAGSAASPVREGTHDFWITYAFPAQGGGEWGFEDLTTSPRKMRGIIRMGGVPPNLTEDTVRGQIGVMLQEVGHHWLVPWDLAFEDSTGSRVSVGSDLTNVQAINDETAFSGPPLVARGNSHWSAYWQADASPFDGVFFVEQGQEDGHAIWEARDFPGPTLSPPGLMPVEMRSSYNDLDRLVMGAMSPSEAYASTGGRFRWLEPRLTAPHLYHAGLFVAFSQYDFLFFGFSEDHRTLGFQRTGGPVARASLGRGYRPLAHDSTAVALRIVRRGRAYYLQARYDEPSAGSPFPAPGAGPRLDDDLDTLAPVRATPDFNATKFRTMGRIDADARPRAVGVIVKKWDAGHLIDFAFQNLAIFQPGNNQLFKTSGVPLGFAPGGNYGALRRGELRLQIPAAGPIVRVKNSRLHTILPFQRVVNGRLVEQPTFDHTTGVDRAPKVLTSAPEGDFALATTAKVWRTIYTPWAGGTARDRRIWGIEKSLPASTTVLSDQAREKQVPPAWKTYKVAFIIVAKERSDITGAMIQRVDAIRRYWDEAFDEATAHQRHSDSGTLTVYPPDLGFGSVIVPEFRTKTISIRNNGPVDVGIQCPASNGGPFQWAAHNLTIPPGDERTISVEFHPPGAGVAQGELNVRSDVPGSPHPIALRGAGVVVPYVP
jgi:hypothetical protein